MSTAVPIRTPVGFASCFRVCVLGSTALAALAGGAPPTSRAPARAPATARLSEVRRRGMELPLHRGVRGCRGPSAREAGDGAVAGRCLQTFEIGRKLKGVRILRTAPDLRQGRAYLRAGGTGSVASMRTSQHDRVVASFEGCRKSFAALAALDPEDLLAVDD